MHLPLNSLPMWSLEVPVVNRTTVWSRLCCLSSDLIRWLSIWIHYQSTSVASEANVTPTHRFYVRNTTLNSPDVLVNGISGVVRDMKLFVDGFDGLNGVLTDSRSATPTFRLHIHDPNFPHRLRACCCRQRLTRLLWALGRQSATKSSKDKRNWR